MMRLGTIGQALYMRLFFHLANLYDGANRQRLVFQKRYDDICTEWLGGLTILTHKSKIVGEQLGHHLDQLVQAGFLASYVIERAKTQGREGFTILFRPGAMFFDDYDRFYRRRQQGQTQWDSGHRAPGHQRASEGRLPLCREAHRPPGRLDCLRPVQGRGDRQAAPRRAAGRRDAGLLRLCAGRGQKDRFRRADPRGHQTVPCRLYGPSKAPGGRKGAGGRSQRTAAAGCRAASLRRVPAIPGGRTSSPASRTPSGTPSRHRRATMRPAFAAARSKAPCSSSARCGSRSSATPTSS